MSPFLYCLGLINLGIIGTDTTHTVVLSRLFNDAAARDHVDGARIVCAYKGGSPDLPLSSSRVDGFAAEARDKYGVTLVDSVAEVIKRSDGILILSLDGRVHLSQAREVFAAGKPVFIDKPLAGDLRSALELAALAREAHAVVFSASSIRFSAGVKALQAAHLGSIRGAVAYGPATIEPSMPDLYYYGIHAAEALYSVLGTGCISVARVHTDDTDIVTGLWSGGRTGVLYGLRTGVPGFGLTVFGTSATLAESRMAAYPELARELVKFFSTRQAPVALETTIEIMAFLEAADESKRRGGAPVALEEVIALAQASHR